MAKRIFEITHVGNEIQIGHDGHHAARLVLDNIMEDIDNTKDFIKEFLLKRTDYFKGITDEFKVLFIDDDVFEKELNDIIR